jgi:RNA polymerase sigma factor (sigma-70 family)
MRQEAALALEAALGQLPADQAEVIRLRHRDGRSFEEIGRLLGRSADAARQLWRRAVERLQEELEPPHDRV